MDNTFETMEIAPAVRLCSYTTDRFTTGKISVSFSVPLEQKRLNENALLPFVLCRSSEDCPSFLEICKRAYELYGADLTPSVHKVGDRHVLNFSITAIENRFALDGEDLMLSCADFLFRIIFRPNLKDGVFLLEEVEKERRIAVERIQNQLNDKRAYAMQRMISEMFAGECYAENKYGTAEGMAAVTPQSLYEAYAAMLRGAGIQINVTGSVNPAEIAGRFETYFSKTDRTPYMLFSTIGTEAETVRRVTEEAPVNQGKLVMGFRLGMNDPDADYEKFKMMCSLFGGGVHSRLFNVVREQMSLCYYCSSNLNREKGYMYVQSGIENKNAEIAEKEILNQLCYVAESSTEDELEKAKLSFRDALASVCDTPDDIDSWMFSQVSDEETETPEAFAEKLMAVTLKEVREAAAAVTLDTVYLLKGTEAELS